LERSAFLEFVFVELLMFLSFEKCIVL